MGGDELWFYEPMLEKEQDTTRIQIHMTRLKETTCTGDAEMMLIEMLTPHEQENPSSDP